MDFPSPIASARELAYCFGAERLYSPRGKAQGSRDAAIGRCKEAIHDCRGDILDFKIFSNLSLSLIVEMSAGGVLALAEALRGLGWEVRLEPEAPEGESLEGKVQLTFSGADGELRVPVPAVPG